MKISGFSNRTGVSHDTIRYYEKIGLLQPEVISKHRTYHDEHIETMITILKLKRCGFALTEIKMLFDLAHKMDPLIELTETELRNVQQIKLLFQRRHDEIIQREKEMEQVKQILSRADEKIESLLAKNK